MLSFFNSPEQALSVFKKGRRMSKNTTNEDGLTESFFANPFGPAQRKKQVNKLLDQYFKKMFEQNIKVGQIYTQLGIFGKEKEGPYLAAKKLLDLLCSN